MQSQVYFLYENKVASTLHEHDQLALRRRQYRVQPNRVTHEDTGPAMEKARTAQTGTML